MRLFLVNSLLFLNDHLDDHRLQRLNLTLQLLVFVEDSFRVMLWRHKIRRHVARVVLRHTLLCALSAHVGKPRPMEGLLGATL